MSTSSVSPLSTAANMRESTVAASTIAIFVWPHSKREYAMSRNKAFLPP